MSGIIKILAIGFLLLTACSQSKWSEADQEKWLKNCNETFSGKNIRPDDKKQLEDLCRCMLKVTSRKYSVEEAAHLNEDQERKIMQNCNYNW